MGGPHTCGTPACRICHNEVTGAGFGRWQHMRAHYRAAFNREPPRSLQVWDMEHRLGSKIRERLLARAALAPGEPA